MITEEQWKRFQDLIYKPIRDAQKQLEATILKAIGDDKPGEKSLLTAKQKQLMIQVAKGIPYSEIKKCGKEQTIKNNISKLCKKFDCLNDKKKSDKSKLVKLLIERGEIVI